MQKSMELNGSVYDDTGTFIYAGVLLFTAILYFPLYCNVQSKITIQWNPLSEVGLLSRCAFFQGFELPKSKLLVT